MVIIILDNVPASVRGEFSRWLLEPKAGVFVGHLSAMVRDKLWEKCCRDQRINSALQIWSTNTEQRFKMRQHGEPTRTIVEFEGIQLIRLPLPQSRTGRRGSLEVLLQRLPGDST